MFTVEKSLFLARTRSLSRVPRKALDPIVIDLSLSVAARGRIVQAEKEGSEIPKEWGVDVDGNPSVDPEKSPSRQLKCDWGCQGNGIGDDGGNSGWCICKEPIWLSGFIVL